MKTRTIKHETVIRPYPLLNSSSGNCEPNQVYFQKQRDVGELIPRSVFPNYIAVILVINIRRFLSCIISIDNL